MGDLTLNEYKGVSEEDLGKILRNEARKMFGSGSCETSFKESVDRLFHFKKVFYAKFRN